MPELPEVETVRRFLEKSVKEKTLADIQVLNDKSFLGDPHLIINSKITDFSRIGKQLTIYLDNNLALLFHLKMTGQLIFVPPLLVSPKRSGGGSKGGAGGILSMRSDSRTILGHPISPAEALAQEGQDRVVLGHPTKNAIHDLLPNNSTRIIFTFSDSSTLYFNDQRKFGWVRIFDPKDLPEFQHDLGPDILSPDFTFEYFQKQLSRSSRPVKLVLLDQSKFAGIGNIYANDSLWEACIHPLTPANKVSQNKIMPLYNAVIDLIQESIAHGGSTAKDNKYIRPDASFGGHQFHFRVYQREGEPCLRCSTPIQRLKAGGRSAWFCPRCQQF